MNADSRDQRSQVDVNAGFTVNDLKKAIILDPSLWLAITPLSNRDIEITYGAKQLSDDENLYDLLEKVAKKSIPTVVFRSTAHRDEIEKEEERHQKAFQEKVEKGKRLLESLSRPEVLEILRELKTMWNVPPLRLWDINSSKLDVRVLNEVKKMDNIPSEKFVPMITKSTQLFEQLKKIIEEEVGTSNQTLLNAWNSIDKLYNNIQSH